MGLKHVTITEKRRKIASTDTQTDSCGRNKITSLINEKEHPKAGINKGSSHLRADLSMEKKSTLQVLEPKIKINP